MSEFIKKAIHPIVNKDKNEKVNERLAFEGETLEVGGNIAVESIEQVGEIRAVSHPGTKIASGTFVAAGTTLILHVTGVLTGASVKVDFSSVTDVQKTSGTETSDTTSPAFQNYYIGANNQLYTGTKKIENFVGTAKVVFKNATTINANTSGTYIYFTTEEYEADEFLPFFKWEDDELKVLKDDNSYGTITVA